MARGAVLERRFVKERATGRCWSCPRFGVADPDATFGLCNKQLEIHGEIEK